MLESHRSPFRSNSFCCGVLPRVTRGDFSPRREYDLATEEPRVIDFLLLGRQEQRKETNMDNNQRGFTVNGMKTVVNRNSTRRKKANGTVQQRPVWFHVKQSVV